MSGQAEVLAELLICNHITIIRYLPRQGIKVLHEGDSVEDKGLVELSIHDGLLQDLACLLVHQVSTGCINGESQERQGVSIRVEEDIGMRAEEEKDKKCMGCISINTQTKMATV